MKRIFNIIVIISVFVGLFYIYDKDTIKILKEEFIINKESEKKINNNFQLVQERINNGPYMYEEIEQVGLEILNIQDTKENDKRIVSFELASNEKKISYDNVSVNLELFNENKEPIATLNKEFKNFTPGKREQIEFDITYYKTKFYKVSYKTKDYTIIKK